MVKSSSGIKLFLVLVTAMASVVRMAPVYSPQTENDDDSISRNPRSTNLSNSKIRLHVHGYYLQILADGTVNGTVNDDPYSIMERTAVSLNGELRIRGIATCNFLCLNECGFLYASKEYVDECIFKETLEINDQNTYTSVKYSNTNHTLYLALNSKGHVRKVITKAGFPLGKRSSSANVLTVAVPEDELKQLETKHEFRHHKFCPFPAKKPKPLKTKCKNKKHRKPLTKSPKNEEDESSSTALLDAGSTGKGKSRKK